MKHTIGEKVFSKSERYDDGKICEIKNNKYFINTGFLIFEIDESEFQYGFYGKTNV